MAPVVQGPLNRAQIDAVTYGTQTSTDHKQLWENTNTTLAQHTATIASQTKLIAALQATVAALQEQVSKL